jgi:hypothetical protein
MSLGFELYAAPSEELPVSHETALELRIGLLENEWNASDSK